MLKYHDNCFGLPSVAEYGDSELGHEEIIASNHTGKHYLFICVSQGMKLAPKNFRAISNQFPQKLMFALFTWRTKHKTE